MPTIINEIQDELKAHVEYYNLTGKTQEAKRLDERVNFDLEMMRELGYCSGIENYSRFFDRRHAGDRPFCLFDYFPEGSQVGTPDLVVSFSQSYLHKGTGIDEYRYFVIPTNLTEAKYLTALEVRPGNKKVFPSVIVIVVT